jgi:subfamily B ATP-binding cassette protein MsbA
MIVSISSINNFLTRASQRFTKIIKPLILDGKSPAAQLTIVTARKEWRLIVIAFVSSIFEALTEGATFGVIFLAVQVLASSGKVSWQTQPFARVLEWLPHASSQLTHKLLFICLLGLALALQLLLSISRYINSVSTGLFGAKIYSTITCIVHSRILALSFPCASRYRVGDLLNTASTSPRAIEAQINQVSAILQNALLSLSYLVILCLLSPWLLLAACVFGIFLTQFQARVIPRIKRSALSAAQVLVELSSSLTQDIQGLRLIHSSGLADRASDKIYVNVRSYERIMQRQILTKELLLPITAFLPVFGITVISGFSVLLFGSKTSGILPSLITFVLALQRLNQRLAGIANSFSILATNAGNVQRLNSLLRSDDKEFRRRGGLPFHHLNRSIEFQNVGLTYSSSNDPALINVNLVIPKGTTLALVGSSGAGKSSLADLLVGLYEPTSGKIVIDEISLQEYELSSWQQQIGVVSQDTFMFNATLSENISYGASGCSQVEIVEAARLAQADRFIRQLPKGYDTVVGERGYRLSGGQRQRISLARALLKHPQLLILDEATSALDSRNERLVQTALEELNRTMTIVIIAHRLSTIVRADSICVMEAGAIVEFGNHSSLLNAKGKYYELWQQQIHSSQAQVLSS